MNKSGQAMVFFRSLRPAFRLFRKNDPLRMAGATAFFTTFALPPIVFILAQLFGFIIGRRAMGRNLLHTISRTLGTEGAEQVRQVIRSIRSFDDSWYTVVFGFLFLVFVATTLFTVIKNSLNQIWQISLKEKPGLLFLLGLRIKSFAVILLIGLLFFADLVFESMQLAANAFIDQTWNESAIYFKGILNELVSLVVVASWFIMLFRFLGDGTPGWKTAFWGGLLTGALFVGGRILLRVLLVNSNISQLYGPSGSMALVLLFVFYSSFILYYGASFIAVYAERQDCPIIPHKKAQSYKIQAL
jgi:membrane protein